MTESTPTGRPMNIERDILRMLPAASHAPLHYCDLGERLDLLRAMKNKMWVDTNGRNEWWRTQLGEAIING